MSVAETIKKIDDELWNMDESALRDVLSFVHGYDAHWSNRRFAAVRMDHADLAHLGPRSRGIYVLRAEGTDRIKIGYSDNLPIRIATIRSGCPVPITLVRVILGGKRSLETDLHLRFDEDRSHGEWFRASPALLAFIEEA